MEEREVLAEFTKTRALLSGHFELRSKLHSDRYFQCAKVLMYPWVAERLCFALTGKMRAACGDAAVDSVIAPAMGGLAVGHEVGRALKVRSIFAEKQDSKLVMRRFAIEAGERFVVAEDVLTRGGRIQETIDIVKGLGGVVQAVLVLVDRSGGKVSFGCPLFSLVKMEPVVWEPADCPLCKAGVAIEHPGS